MLIIATSADTGGLKKGVPVTGHQLTVRWVDMLTRSLSFGIKQGLRKAHGLVLFVAAFLPFAPAYASDYSPFVNAEAVYTDNGYNKGLFPGGGALGAGFTTGVIIVQKHEFSVSTGFTQWKGDQFSNPFNPVRGYLQLKQVPLLLNYRFHFAIDEARRVNISVGPTLGVISQELYWKNEAAPLLLRSQTDQEWQMVVGGSAGLNFKLSPHWTMDARVQYLRGDATGYRISSVAMRMQFDQSNTDSWSYALGVGYSW